MKKTLLALAAFGLVAVQSCKKDDNTTVTAALNGNWKLASRGIDANNDGAIQSSETLTLQSGESGSLNITDQIIKDSTKLDGFGISITYPYTRRNDTVFLQGFAGSDPIFVINRLSATNLDIYMPDSASTEWRYYTR